MNKKNKAIITLSLAILLGGSLTAGIMSSKTLAEESKPIESTELITPDSERGKELIHQALTEPAKDVHSKHGDFKYVEVPSTYPSNEVANLDRQDEITPDTRQVILKGHVYEKE